MSPFIFILSGFLPTIVMIIAVIRKNIKRNKYYRVFYNTLPFKRFYISDRHVFSHRYGQKNDGFIWFLDSNSFCLGGGNYLSYTSGAPVGHYWKRKFQRWFKENVNPGYLLEYLQSRSYPSSLKSEEDFASPYAYDAYLRRYYTSIILCAFAHQDELTKDNIHEIVKQVSKLVAELRFKEKTESESNEKKAEVV